MGGNTPVSLSGSAIVKPPVIFSKVLRRPFSMTLFPEVFAVIDSASKMVTPLVRKRGKRLRKTAYGAFPF